MYRCCVCCSTVGDDPGSGRLGQAVEQVLVGIRMVRLGMRRLDANELVWIHQRCVLKCQRACVCASDNFLPNTGLQRRLVGNDDEWLSIAKKDMLHT